MTGGTDTSTSVSVIICTRDRAADLALTLSSLARVRIPRAWRVESLIVDNGSRDRTHETAAAFSWPGATVRVLTEPRAGQANARNRGLAEANGDVMVFTDDDVRFDAGWLEALCLPIVRGDAQGVLGAIRIPTGLQRQWLTPMLRAFLGSTELITDPPPFMIGANMAFARSVLRDVPAFDQALGPGALGFYDDTLFSWQLLQAGHRLRFSPQAVVEHHFSPGRLGRPQLLAFARRHARCRAYVEHHWEHKPLAGRWSEFKFNFRAWRQFRRTRILSEEVTEEEFECVHDIHTSLEHLVLMLQPRRYARRGPRRLKSQ